jgi:hypothetical protein
VHDYIPKAIKLLEIDPQDPSRRTGVLVSLAHIVRLVPQYYVESGGRRMVSDISAEDALTQPSESGLKRYFLILDALGGRFESHSASGKAQAMLEQMWNESV